MTGASEQSVSPARTPCVKCIEVYLRAAQTIGPGQMGRVELRVSEGGRDILVYTLKSVGEAAEMIRFLADFLPRAEFVIQPLRH